MAELLHSINNIQINVFFKKHFRVNTMKSYNLIERQLARTLDTFPQLRQIAKTIYQRLNYWYFGQPGFQLTLHPQVKLFKPSEWIGKSEDSAELFFGYYDKSPWSPDMKQVVFHRLKDNSQVHIVVYDREKQESQVVGVSSTWSLQQGCMTQWMPIIQQKKLIFNDLVEGKLASRIIDVDRNNETVIPWPIQTLHPEGKEALTLNYKRLDRLRPEYGYPVPVNNFSGDSPLGKDGIWHVNLDSGQGELVLSLSQLIANQSRPEMADSEHKVNHIMYSPQGTRFVFMHRWLSSQGKFSRLYVANFDGSNLRLLMGDRMVSHYSWRDEENLLVWGRTQEAGDRYYLLNILSGQWQIIGEGILDVYGDGHPSFSPDRRWIVTDTYPDRARQQRLLIYQVETGQLIEVGRFLEPWQFKGPSRCDLHPRWSPDGKMISIDSSHEGKRMTYILDVSLIVNTKY